MGMSHNLILRYGKSKGLRTIAPSFVVHKAFIKQFNKGATMTKEDKYTPGPSGINRKTKQKNASKKYQQRLKNLAERAERSRGKGRK
jgi:hypothetical protein